MRGKTQIFKIKALWKRDVEYALVIPRMSHHQPILHLHALTEEGISMKPRMTGGRLTTSAEPPAKRVARASKKRETRDKSFQIGMYWRTGMREVWVKKVERYNLPHNIRRRNGRCKEMTGRWKMRIGRWQAEVRISFCLVLKNS